MAASTSESTVIPVIMAGGSGTRLWPLSRQLYPKQFLSLVAREQCCRKPVNACLV